MFKFLSKKNRDDLINKKIDTKKANSYTDIKDDDMMVAVLVATIDYSNDVKKNIKLISVKQVNEVY